MLSRLACASSKQSALAASALSDEELDARIEAVMAALLAEYGSVDAIAASYRADGNEPAARLVEGYRERTI